MIKFKGSHKGRAFVGLCLEKGNVKQLQKGNPVHIAAEEMGLPHDIMIFYGDTVQHIFEELKAHGFDLPPQDAWLRPTNTRN